MNDTVLVEAAADGVMVLTLNRPAQRNAINQDMVAALTEALAAFRDDPRWRAGVITGAAPAFCAGLDLKTFSATEAPRHLVTALITSLPALGKPMIAAVGGAAYTGGLEIALACDFILAAPEARFADTHAKIGALSGSGMGSRLPWAVGARFARQMMLSGAPIDADTALRVGMVNEVVPTELLLSRAIDIATTIAGHDPEIVRIAKEVIDRGTQTTLAEAIVIERDALAERNARGAMEWRT